MPTRRKGKKSSSKRRTTRTNASANGRRIGTNPVDDPAPKLAPPHGTRSGLRSDLRSRPSTDFATSFEVNPESLLRKNRQNRKSTKQAEDKPARASLQTPPRDIYSLLAETYGRTNYSVSDDASAEDTPFSLQSIDTEQRFNSKWGYLPPLDEDALAVIEAIIANPEMAQKLNRTNPEHSDFPEGLRNRNVSLKESQDKDPQSDDIYLLAPGELTETDGEKESYIQLWASDKAKCSKGSNEALFQRTIMMSLIARHRLIYSTDPTTQCLLDFSVDEAWTCPPMPTRAHWKGESFLTQPKPDLAVCFNREALIPDHLWDDMPRTTKRLACYESADEIGGEKVFHFLTIEAKKARTSTADAVALRQSLNNASQSLHNFFEFFREAGPHQEDVFFAKVRFFSVVASTEGVVVRIHRATRKPADGSSKGFVIPQYPLRFEYEEFCNIPRDKFERKVVFETFEKILLGYGAKKLHPLLQTAAEGVVEKLMKDPQGMLSRGDKNFYRYGQTAIPQSKKSTPATSRAESVQNDVSFESQQSERLAAAPSPAQLGTNVSFEMSRFGIDTPRRGVGKVLNDDGKRRGENNAPTRRVRKKKQ